VMGEKDKKKQTQRKSKKEKRGREKGGVLSLGQDCESIHHYKRDRKTTRRRESYFEVGPKGYGKIATFEKKNCSLRVSLGGGGNTGLSDLRVRQKSNGKEKGIPRLFTVI